MALVRFVPVWYKRLRFAAGALVTFGCAFGLPGAVEAVFEADLPEFWHVILMFTGFFAGAIGGGELLDRLMGPKCPRCAAAMGVTWKNGMRGRKETFLCPVCGFQYTATYPTMKTGGK